MNLVWRNYLLYTLFTNGEAPLTLQIGKLCVCIFDDYAQYRQESEEHKLLLVIGENINRWLLWQHVPVTYKSYVVFDTAIQLSRVYSKEVEDI